MLESYAPEQRVSVVCNVSSRVDVRQARTAILVNFDAIRDPRAGSLEEFDLGIDTDAGDNQVAFESSAGFGDDTLDPYATLEQIDPITQYKVYSVRAMKFGDHGGDLGPEDADQRGRR